MSYQVYSLIFFKALKKRTDFAWTDECEQSLAVLEAVVSAILVRQDEGKELPVFYISRAFIDPETRYPNIEKISMALIVVARKLRPHF